MLKHLRRIPLLVKDTIKDWRRYRLSLMAAGIAYYTFFSIIPLLVIAAAIGALIFGQAVVNGQLETSLGSLFGERTASVIEAALTNAYSSHSGGTVLAAIAALLLGASYTFIQVRNALNLLWGVNEKPGFGNFVEGRLLSLVMVVGVALLLVLWIALGTAFSTLLVLWNSIPIHAAPPVVFEAINFLALFLVSALLFAMVYKLLPSVKLTWEDVWLGSFVTSFLFIIGEYVLAFYLGRVDVGSVYGAVGSIAGLLLWLYVSSQLFLFGAAFTKAYARRHGSHKGKHPVTVTTTNVNPALLKKDSVLKRSSEAGLKASLRAGRKAGRKALKTVKSSAPRTKTR